MGKTKVLIVDDYENITRQIKRIIQEILSDSEIDCAYDKKEALRFLKEKRYSIITLDGQLGEGEHGRDILKKMSPEQKQITIVISADLQFLEECDKHGIALVNKNRDLFEDLKKIISFRETV